MTSTSATAATTRPPRERPARACHASTTAVDSPAPLPLKARPLSIHADLFERLPPRSPTRTRPLNSSDLKQLLDNVVASSDGRATATFPLIASDAPYTIPSDRCDATVRVDDPDTQLVATVAIDAETASRSVDVTFTKPISLTNPASLVFGSGFIAGLADNLTRFDLKSLKLREDGTLIAMGALVLFGFIPVRMRQSVMTLHFDGLQELLAGHRLTDPQREHLDLLLGILLATGAMTAQGRYILAADTHIERALPLVLDAGRIPIPAGTMHHTACGTLDLRRNGAIHMTVAKSPAPEHESQLASIDMHGSGRAKISSETGLDFSAALAVTVNDIDIAGVFEPAGARAGTSVPLNVRTGHREEPPVHLSTDLFYDGRGLVATGALTLTDVPTSVGSSVTGDPNAPEVSFPLGGGTVTTTGIDAVLGGELSFDIQPRAIQVAGPVDLHVSDGSSSYELERNVELKIDTQTGAVVLQGYGPLHAMTH